MLELAAVLITGLLGLLGVIMKIRGESRIAELERLARELDALAKAQANEIDFRSESLALTVDVSDWSGITNELSDLMRTSEIDRFLILNAFNGYHDPRWTTAVYQVKRGADKLMSYVHFGIDPHYVGLLKKIREAGSTAVNVSLLPDSIIRSVYLSESVLGSEWFFLGSKQNNQGSVALTYCSFSSKTESDISPATHERCRVLVNQIIGALDKGSIKVT